MEKIDINKLDHDIEECERGLRGVRSCIDGITTANWFVDQGDEEGFQDNKRRVTGEMLFHIERLTAWVAILEEGVREMRKKGG